MLPSSSLMYPAKDHHCATEFDGCSRVFVFDFGRHNNLCGVRPAFLQDGEDVW